jgi:hypothetical protein
MRADARPRRAQNTTSSLAATIVLNPQIAVETGLVTGGVLVGVMRGNAATIFSSRIWLTETGLAVTIAQHCGLVLMQPATATASSSAAVRGCISSFKLRSRELGKSELLRQGVMDV